MSVARTYRKCGATVIDSGVFFRVWAPNCQKVEVALNKGNDNEIIIPMHEEGEGYHAVTTDSAQAGDLYQYILDEEKRRPDPVSRYLPHTLHGKTMIVDPHSFRWNDQLWRGVPLDKYVIYELHVGTFTEEGTFAGVEKKLDYLADLGITCIEIMPVSQFPGRKNWGYDGASLYAVQDSYGGPEGLRHLVDSAHKKGIAVCLDVVYNHFGPEGNYLYDYGPYFTDRIRTNWGDALNYCEAGSEPVRDFILQNVEYWLTEYHIDSLRLDAIHGIFDVGALHILREMHDVVTALGRLESKYFYLIAESDLNDRRIIDTLERGGYGMDAQWSDDFHHAQHALLSGETNGYYEDFGTLEDLAIALERSFVFNGRYSPHRKRRHGNDPIGLLCEQFVVATQNHDQIGNRAFGDRLATHLTPDMERLSAVMLLLAPYIPLLYMGQEYGETAPFQYFIDHTDSGLVELVQEGRKNEFKAFGWDEVPDPAADSTFENSRLQWNLFDKEPHPGILECYRTCLEIRKKFNPAGGIKIGDVVIRYSENEKWLSLSYKPECGKDIGYLLNFNENNIKVKNAFPGRKKGECLLNTEEKRFAGSGNLKIEPEKTYTVNDLEIGSKRAIVFYFNQKRGG